MPTLNARRGRQENSAPDYAVSASRNGNGWVANGHDAHASGFDRRRQYSIADALRIVRRGDSAPIDNAMAWAVLGFPVHPADPDPAKKKKPLVTDFQRRATTDLTQIERWWKRWPNALIATPSDDHWLLDCDNPNKHRDAQGNPRGADGIGSAERLFGPLDELSSFRFVSPSGGINIAFKRRPGEHPISRRCTAPSGKRVRMPRYPARNPWAWTRSSRHLRQCRPSR